MSADKTGHIVWHDLFTGDRPAAMAFYERVAGWTYRVERATDFAWGGGETDFVLALSGDEAGAGLLDTPPGLGPGWVPYIEVPDVDSAVARAEGRGATVLRTPFEVPGVGRNALLRDPFGARVGVSLSRHSFPAPRRQFGPERYLTAEKADLLGFYGPVFGWGPDRDSPGRLLAPSGDPVALGLAGAPPSGARAVWVPSLKVPSVAEAAARAEASGASGTRPPLLIDPHAVPFSLQRI